MHLQSPFARSDGHNTQRLEGSCMRSPLVVATEWPSAATNDSGRRHHDSRHDSSDHGGAIHAAGYGSDEGSSEVSDSFVEAPLPLPAIAAAFAASRLPRRASCALRVWRHRTRHGRSRATLARQLLEEADEARHRDVRGELAAAAKLSRALLARLEQWRRVAAERSERGALAAGAASSAARLRLEFEWRRLVLRAAIRNRQAAATSVARLAASRSASARGLRRWTAEARRLSSLRESSTLVLSAMERRSLLYGEECEYSQAENKLAAVHHFIKGMAKLPLGTPNHVAGRVHLQRSLIEEACDLQQHGKGSVLRFPPPSASLSSFGSNIVGEAHRGRSSNTAWEEHSASSFVSNSVGRAHRGRSSDTAGEEYLSSGVLRIETPAGLGLTGGPTAAKPRANRRHSLSTLPMPPRRAASASARLGREREESISFSGEELTRPPPVNESQQHLACATHSFSTPSTVACDETFGRNTSSGVSSRVTPAQNESRKPSTVSYRHLVAANDVMQAWGAQNESRKRSTLTYRHLVTALNTAQMRGPLARWAAHTRTLTHARALLRVLSGNLRTRRLTRGLTSLRTALRNSRAVLCGPALHHWRHAATATLSLSNCAAAAAVLSLSARYALAYWRGALPQLQRQSRNNAQAIQLQRISALRRARAAWNTAVGNRTLARLEATTLAFRRQARGLLALRKKAIRAGVASRGEEAFAAFWMTTARRDALAAWRAAMRQSSSELWARCAACT